MLNNWSLDLFLNLNFALKTKKFDPTTLCYLDIQPDNVVVFFVSTTGLLDVSVMCLIDKRDMSTGGFLFQRTNT
jgi:hypothetical protein